MSRRAVQCDNCGRLVHVDSPHLLAKSGWRLAATEGTSGTMCPDCAGKLAFRPALDPSPPS